jgi:(p)ppGpp synthase/HD superfamily hydrolase
MQPDTADLLRAAVFAARAHSGQTRKGAAQEPYVNHVLEVAQILSAHGAPKVAVLAGLLHDTVEDTAITLEELAEAFGAEVAGIVAEATDDKALPKETRKALQVSHAAQRSDAAKQLKLADKISNLRAIMHSPPRNWDHGRRTEYIGWAARVAAGLKGVNPSLDALFDETYRAAIATLAADAP